VRPWIETPVLAARKVQSPALNKDMIGPQREEVPPPRAASDSMG
jgi:hypothetical protein